MQRWLVFILICLPTLALAKTVTFTITPNYSLSLTDTQIICTSLYANLSTTALLKTERTQGSTPYSCTLLDGKLEIKFALK